MDEKPTQNKETGASQNDQEPLHFNKRSERETYGFPHTKVIYDSEGHGLKVCMLDGKPVPPFGEKHFRKIQDLELKDDDILLCGYPKTGSHWAWEILYMIMSKKAEHSSGGKPAVFLEMAPLSLINSNPSPRILNTHVWFDYLPTQIKEKKTKIIMTYRNPKDVAVSYYNHHVTIKDVYGYDGPFHLWFPLYLDGQVDYGSYCDYHRDWEKAIKENPATSILVVAYEDLKKDLPSVICRMSKFLEVELDDRLVSDIAKAAGFDYMKKEYEDKKFMSSKLLRKGQVGDWKNWLTVAQSEAIDRVVEEKLQDTRFKPIYTL